MKKKISIVLIFTMLFGLALTSNAAVAKKFSDVKSNAYYKSDLDYITKDKRKIIVGFSDGTFKPNSPFTVAQLIKCVIAAKNIKVPAKTKKELWYDPYVKKAIQLGYVKNGEFSDYARAATRGETARILVRAIGKYSYRDSKKIVPLIKDYNSIPANLKDSVVKAYDIGLIGGYTNGNFGAKDKLVRAQAVSVIRRFVDPYSRLKLSLSDGITFNPSKDVDKHEKVNPDKVEEFAMKIYNSLQLYTKDGKAYAKGYIPESPNGFKIHFGIYINPHKGGIGISTETVKKDYLLPSSGNFDKYLTINKKDIEMIEIWVSMYKEGTPDSGCLFSLDYPEKEIRKIVWGEKTVKIKVPEGVFRQW